MIIVYEFKSIKVPKCFYSLCMKELSPIHSYGEDFVRCFFATESKDKRSVEE